MTQCAAAAGELFAADGRVSLEWPGTGDVRLVPGGPQLLLNLIVLMAGALPRGGQVVVAIAEHAGRAMARLAARGLGAKLSDSVQAVVRGRDEPLDHSNIHAWYCERLARRLATEVAIVAGTDEVRLEVVIERLMD